MLQRGLCQTLDKGCKYRSAVLPVYRSTGVWGDDSGELTGWPPALCLLLYLIVVTTIYRIRMCLGLGHGRFTVHMSAFRRVWICRSMVSLRVEVDCCARLLMLATKFKRRADAKDVPGLRYYDREEDDINITCMTYRVQIRIQ